MAIAKVDPFLGEDRHAAENNGLPPGLIIQAITADWSRCKPGFRDNGNGKDIAAALGCGHS